MSYEDPNTICLLGLVKTWEGKIPWIYYWAFDMGKKGGGGVPGREGNLQQAGCGITLSGRLIL